MQTAFYARALETGSVGLESSGCDSGLPESGHRTWYVTTGAQWLEAQVWMAGKPELEF